MVLSHFQVDKLIAARQSGIEILVVSLDLGLTTSEVKVEPSGVTFPGGQQLAWMDLEMVHENKVACFSIEGNSIRKIQSFSNETNQLFSLMPTRGAPTMLISGIPMHRTKDVEPFKDTTLKIKAIRPVVGHILDTATGLGYTAIQAARTAKQVTTIEINPAALEIARQNPWSQDLFNNPKINQLVGDTFEEIEKFDQGSFTRIIHDPPAFSLAGDLYSGEFYQQLWRVLRSGGRLFHYMGDLESKSGRNISKGAARRLKEAGFDRVERRPEAFGLVAYK